MVNIDKFLEIEKKFDLYRDTVEGINYWVYARVHIWYNVILKECVDIGFLHITEKSNLKERVKIYSKLILNSIKANITKKCDLCIVNHSRRVYQKEHYECIYTDDIAQKLPKNIVLEFPNLMKHLKPVKTENLVYMDEIILKKIVGTLLYKIINKKKYKQIMLTVRNRTTGVLDEIEKAYGININREEIVNFILREIIYYKVSIKSIKKIIGKINPRIVIEVVSYNSNCMMINEVCKKMNIKTIELQHGILTNHIAYNFNSDIEIEQIPDKILLFSEYWKQYINWPIEKKNIIATGFPYFEKKIKEAKKIEEYNDGKKNIIFISQGTIGKKLSEIASQLANILDKDSYRVFYKLHPGEFSNWKEQYSCLENKNIFILDNNKIDLYDYFATCQIQIGVYSTALYEGLGFGLETYIYKIEMSQQMEKLSQLGYAEYFTNVGELKKHIEQGRKEQKVIEKFWGENALNNIVEEIMNVVKQG